LVTGIGKAWTPKGYILAILEISLHTDLVSICIAGTYRSLEWQEVSVCLHCWVYSGDSKEVTTIFPGDIDCL
jgi:hypothetical protein